MNLLAGQTFVFRDGCVYQKSTSCDRKDRDSVRFTHPMIVRLTQDGGQYRLMMRGEKVRGVVGFVPLGLRDGDVLRVEEVKDGDRACFTTTRVSLGEPAPTFVPKGGHSLLQEGGWHHD